MRVSHSMFKSLIILPYSPQTIQERNHYYWNATIVLIDSLLDEEIKITEVFPPDPQVTSDMYCQTVGTWQDVLNHSHKASKSVKTSLFKGIDLKDLITLKKSKQKTTFKSLSFQIFWTNAPW